MSYCKHCEEKISSGSRHHHCKKKGLLNIDEDDSFLVSAIIGAATDSTLLGGILGGSFLGSMLGNILDDSIDDSDDDDWDD